MSDILLTPSEIIDELGGNPAVARLCSTDDEPVTAKAVSNWRNDFLPAKTYPVIQRELRRRKKRAPDSCWRVIPADQGSQSVIRRRA